MKTVLKSVFIARVKELLAAGIKPAMQTSPITCWGNLVWHNAEGIRQVEPLYSAHDCSSITARRDRQRFNAWFDAAHVEFYDDQIAAAGIKIGSQVFDKGTYTTRTVTTIRNGMLVLDGLVEVMLADVELPRPDAAPVMDDPHLGLPHARPASTREERNALLMHTIAALRLAEDRLASLVDSYGKEGHFSACHPKTGLANTNSQLLKIRQALIRAKV